VANAAGFAPNVQAIWDGQQQQQQQQMMQATPPPQQLQLSVHQLHYQQQCQPVGTCKSAGSNQCAF
jgi:hypothetical protein